MGKRAARSVTLDPELLTAAAVTVDLVALDRALEVLARSQPEYSQVVELHLFAGLDVDETATVLGVTERTVYRKLRAARAWLTSELELNAAAPREHAG